MNLVIPSERTITAGGAATVTRAHEIVGANSGTTDDLDTITGGGTNGNLHSMTVIIEAATGDTITVRDASASGSGGNIELRGNANIVLAPGDVLRMFYNGQGVWTDF